MTVRSTALKAIKLSILLQLITQFSKVNFIVLLSTEEAFENKAR